MVKRTFFVACLALASAWLLTGSAVSAAFFAQASAGGMVFRSLSVDLEVSNSASWEEPAQFFSEVSLHGADDLIPGGPIRSEVFWVKNVSKSPRTLRVFGQLLGNANPSLLDDLLEIRVISENSPLASWQSLRQWAEVGGPFENGDLLEGQARRFQLEYRLLPRYPSDPDGDGPRQASDIVGDEVFEAVSGPWSFALRGNIQEEQ